jgi:Family of unknown function (DUF6174)
MSSTDSSPQNPHEAKIRKTSGCLPWILLAAGCLILGGMVGLFMAVSQRPPVMDAHQFDMARKRWDENRIPNYRVEIVVEGAQPATYVVEVRDGTAVKALRNGNPLTQLRTFATWSVDGMFGTLESDVASLESQLEKSGASGSPPTLMLRAEFDPKYGYPKRYFRADWQRNLETLWTVTRFEELGSVN